MQTMWGPLPCAAPKPKHYCELFPLFLVTIIMSTTRPGALSISSARAGRFAGQAISPRTPSSRASAHFRTDSMLREPLLASSDANYEFDTSSEEALSSAVNGTRTLAGQGFTPSTIRALLLGSLITAFALALSVLHLYSKNVEQISDVSVTHNSSMTLAHIISYENYTVFPLQPEQYLAECRALTGNFMPNTGYWTTPSMGIADVVHPLDDGRTDVCLSTITYMLDGRVGLMADLALVAQTAAMAREVWLVDNMSPYHRLTKESFTAKQNIFH